MANEKQPTNLEYKAPEDSGAIMKQTAQQFYEVLKELINQEIENYLKQNNFFRLITGEVKQQNKNKNSFIIDIGDTTIPNVLNKSNLILNKGDTITLLDRFGGNFRNSFILCRNGDENTLEEQLQQQNLELQKKIAELEEEIANLKDSTTTS